jgi:hypothetical protein
VIFKEGEDYYSKDFGLGRNRWGNYSQSTVDPIKIRILDHFRNTRGTRVIQDNQQTTNASRWGTWWQRFQPVVRHRLQRPTPSPTPSGVRPLSQSQTTGTPMMGRPATAFAPRPEASARCGRPSRRRTRFKLRHHDINFSVTATITLGAGLPDLNHKSQP